MIVTPLNWFINGIAPPTPYDYSGANLLFSLQKIVAFSDAVLFVERDSDNATAYVFFDGAVSYDTITLNSYISTTSSAIPDTTTLTTWAGSSNVYVRSWIPLITVQSGTYPINSGTPNSSGLLSDKPKLISSGSLVTKNGSVSLQFSGGDALYHPTQTVALGNTNDFTVFSVGSNNSTTDKYPLLHTGRTTANAFTLLIDSSASNEMAYAYGNVTPATANYSTSITTTNQRLITSIYTPTSLSAWYNGGLESETGVTHSGTYTNDEFYMGRKQNAVPSFLDGHIQEMIIYASDQSANRAAIEADINTRYTIY